ncbi:dTDP-4-dehydrorhamnose reductase [Alkaliflexus imshenetskii]|uniref:dTDP-4-dehydrorhamnose reductase n=1 Tax=Alkaliflexus imshenetskii TaxID=286730 RepID=UPI00047BEF64|nr:dTDP-4-dehydrorhamnose reductase [Alkaliflexus imshenetskii]
MKVLIIGGEGQLGTVLNNLTSSQTFASFDITTIELLDLSQEDNIRIFFAGKKYDFVVNCSAYTAVDKAETDRDTAFLLNALAPGWIGKYAAQMHAGVIHVSTDYVFDGTANTPLTPEMPVNPVSQYGKSKLEGELHLMAENPDSIIIRTAWLYSPYGQNFMKTMLRLASERDELNVVFDQVGSPTSATDLATAIMRILQMASENRESFIPGVYHYANEGVCSWYDFAIMIFKLAGISCKVNAVRTDAYPTPARRPAYSVMDKHKIKEQFGLTIPYWVDSLEAVIENYQPN